MDQIQIVLFGRNYSNKTWRFFQSIILPINKIDDIVLALEIIGQIYFPLIKYCTLVLTDSNHLSLLTLRLEEGAELFWAQTTPLTPPAGSNDYVACFG